ncbi:TPA: hypothetical protein ACGPAT_002220, partial [Streptococcus suis]
MAKTASRGGHLDPQPKYVYSFNYERIVIQLEISKCFYIMKSSLEKLDFFESFFYKSDNLKRKIDWND